VSEAKPSKPPRKLPEHIEVFYDVRDCSFWYRVNGRFMTLKKADLKIELQTMGLRQDNWVEGMGITEIDWVFRNAIHKRAIDYAGSISGHRAGVFEDGGGRKYLVTDEPRGVWDDLPKGKVKAPEFFRGFIEELLPDGQWQHFCFWLSLGLQALRDADFRPAQCCVFAGPVRCGKSLLQSIITEILGGRVANPMKYMMQETTFNKDLAGAEHWMIEEPKTTTDTRTRIAFGNSIKECFNNRLFAIHGKGKEALTLPLFRRGTISVNDEPELLQVLPPFNGSVDDKISLYHCARVETAFEAFKDKTGKLDQPAMWSAIMKEIPQIRAWLLTEFRAAKIPKGFRGDDRAGIDAYHDPELKKQLMSFAPEVRLLGLMDELFFADDATEPQAGVKGKAIEIEQKLRKSEFSSQVENMFRHGQCGSYLGRLSKSVPDRVLKHVRDGYTTWEIKPPVKQQ